MFDKVNEKMLITALKVLPKNQLSWLFGQVASIKFPKPVNEFLIKKFAEFYNINLRDLEYPITYYKSLNHFFTRTLRKNARPYDNSENTVVSPCDGEISEFGKIEDGKLLQVKGKYFTLKNFLKNDDKAREFNNGDFLTIYLSPSDYHRVHVPYDSELLSYEYIKGKLFPVNKLSTDNIPELFSTNERVIFYFKSKKFGNYALVMVGATNVGSISLSFDDFKTNKLLQKPKKVEAIGLNFKKMDELGIFNLGSTVILLFQKDSVKFSDFKKEEKIKLGNTIANV